METNPIGHGWTENDIRSTLKREKMPSPWTATPEKIVQYITTTLGEIFQEAKVDTYICTDFPNGYLIIFPSRYTIRILRSDPRNIPGSQDFPPTQESITINHPTSEEIHGGRKPFVQYTYEHRHNSYEPGVSDGTNVYNFNSPDEWQCRFFNAQTERAFVDRPITEELLGKIQWFLDDIKQILSLRKTGSVIDDTKSTILEYLEPSATISD